MTFFDLPGRWRRLRKAFCLLPHMDQLYDMFEARGGASLSGYERELLSNTLALSGMVARDVCVPRTDVVLLPVSASPHDVLQRFAETGFSRMPVTGASPDDIKGFVHLKDVAALFLKGGTGSSLAEIVHPVPFVPETMPLMKVLQVMHQARVAIAIVVDEFGGMSGLVALSDILRQLVGDIVDEGYGQDEASLMDLGNGRFYARGSLSLEAFDQTMGTHLQEAFGHDVETLGGAVLHVAHHIPAQGEKVRLLPKLEVTVTAVNSRRVLAVEVVVG